MADLLVGGKGNAKDPDGLGNERNGMCQTAFCHVSCLLDVFPGHLECPPDEHGQHQDDKPANRATTEKSACTMMHVQHHRV